MQVAPLAVGQGKHELIGAVLPPSTFRIWLLFNLARVSFLSESLPDNSIFFIVKKFGFYCLLSLSFSASACGGISRA
jgi:hypothetical protein